MYKYTNLNSDFLSWTQRGHCQTDFSGEMELYYKNEGNNHKVTKCVISSPSCLQ